MVWWRRTPGNSGSQPSGQPRRLGSRGQVMVLFAIMLIPLTMMAALVFDLGTGLVERRTLQNYADAAAMAATQAIGDNAQPPIVLDKDVDTVINDVITAANVPSSRLTITAPTGFGSTVGQLYLAAQYVDASGSPLSPATYVSNGVTPVSGSADGAQVTVTAIYSTYFAGAIGVHTVQVSASATAVGKRVIPAGVQGLLPLAARWDPPYGPPAAQTYANANGPNVGCVNVVPTTPYQCHAEQNSVPDIKQIPVGTTFFVWSNGNGWLNTNTGPQGGPGTDEDWQSGSHSFKGVFTNLNNNCANANQGSGEGSRVGQIPTNKKGVAMVPVVDWSTGPGRNITVHIYGLLPLYFADPSGNPALGTLVSKVGSWSKDATCGATVIDPTGQSPFISAVLLS